jgi:hypothetical protein
MFKFQQLILVFCWLSLLPQRSHADAPPSVRGIIGNVSVNPHSGQDFRVFIKTAAQHCPGTGANYAYFNMTENGAQNPYYKTLMATLLLARTTGDQVILYTANDGKGFCRVSGVVVVDSGT